MDRKTFMRELEYLLQDIQIEERKEALDYYESYFDEAGIENEKKVIEELGDPSQVAAMIKDGLNDRFDDHIESGNEGFSNQKYNRNYEVVDSHQRKTDGCFNILEQLKIKWKQLDKKDKTILVVLLVIACLPISSIFVGLSGGFLGIVIIFTCLFFSLWIITFVLYALSIFLIVIGVLQLFHLAGAGLIIIGAGCILISIASVFEKLASLFFKKVVPTVIDGLSSIFTRLFGNRGVQA